MSLLSSSTDVIMVFDQRVRHSPYWRVKSGNSEKVVICGIEQGVCREGSYPALELTPLLLVTGGGEGLAPCYNLGQMYKTAYESRVRDSHVRDCFV